jgi:hypothetical protein
MLPNIIKQYHCARIFIPKFSDCKDFEIKLERHMCDGSMLLAPSRAVSLLSCALMDDSKSLDVLANVMNELAEKPFDVAIHLQHIRLAESLPGMEAEATSAREMMSGLLAVGDDVWLPLLDAKEKSVNLETEDGLVNLFALYDRAEADYLCA